MNKPKHGKTSRGVSHSKYIKDGLAKSKANAALIAAAPELLKALENAADVLESYSDHEEFSHELRKAIAKARGES